MISLINKLENEVEFDGKVYKVNTSFDNVLRIYDLSKTAHDTAEVLCKALENLIGFVPDLPAQELLLLLEELFKWFISTGETQSTVRLDLKGNPLPVQRKGREWISFEYDANYIYAAFWQSYGIDLVEEQGKLEWKKFKALLDGIPKSTKLSEIMEIRQQPYPKGKGTQKEREELKRMKKQFSFPGEDFSVDIKG